MICWQVDGSYRKGLNCWFARDVMVGMLLIKNKRISLRLVMWLQTRNQFNTITDQGIIAKTYALLTKLVQSRWLVILQI